MKRGLSTLLLICLPAICYSQERPAGVKAEYDKFKDVTSITLEPQLLYGRDPADTAVAAAILSEATNLPLRANYDALIIALRTTVKSYPIREPEHIGLIILSISNRPRFRHDQELILLIDGKRLRLGNMDVVTSKEYPDGTIETLTMLISYKTFVQIASGDKVEGKIGPQEFLISETLSKQIREFVRRCHPE
jgi:hypothetical protein